MRDLFLVEPNKKYEKSFKKYVMAYKETNDEFYYNIYKKALDSFDEYIKDLSNYSKGINVSEGWVPFSTFWLINHDEVIGVARVRHKEIGHAGHMGADISPYHRNKGYGTETLALSLEKAKEIGLKEVIVTCNINNSASKKVIEKNNGKLLEVISHEEENEKLYKFSISL